MVAQVACLVLTIYIRAWIVMLAWGSVAADLEIPTVGYPAAFLVVLVHQAMVSAITYGQ